MLAQPSTDAFKPTIKLPDTAEPDVVVELFGTAGDGGTAAAGTLGAAADWFDAAAPACGRGRGAGFRLLVPVRRRVP